MTEEEVSEWNRFSNGPRVHFRDGQAFCFGHEDCPPGMTRYVLHWKKHRHGSAGSCEVSCFGKCAIDTLLSYWHRINRRKNFYTATLVPSSQKRSAQ